MPDLSTPHHLPNRRRNGEPPPSGWLPRQRHGTTPQMIGRYPDYDVFSAVDTWDAATRRAIDERMALAGRELTFFRPEEEATVRAFSDVALAQDDEPRVPVVEMVDEKLAAGRLDGYQYADMPDDRDTWHLVLQGLEEASRSGNGRGFIELTPDEREDLVRRFSQGELSGGVWERLDQKHAWSVCMRMLLSAFYSHPWAWNEIGFGGPAYPRGFMRFGTVSVLEPFEEPGATDEDPVQVADVTERERP